MEPENRGKRARERGERARPGESEAGEEGAIEGIRKEQEQKNKLRIKRESKTKPRAGERVVQGRAGSSKTQPTGNCPPTPGLFWGDKKREKLPYLLKESGMCEKVM